MDPLDGTLAEVERAFEAVIDPDQSYRSDRVQGRIEAARAELSNVDDAFASADFRAVSRLLGKIRRQIRTVLRCRKISPAAWDGVSDLDLALTEAIDIFRRQFTGNPE